jgi:hypothetical protein
MKTARAFSLLSSGALAAIFSGCTPTAENTNTDRSAASAKGGALEGHRRGDGRAMMGSMGSMAGPGATDSMEGRLHTMDMMSASQIKATFPAHSQAVRDMLSRMRADVQGMHVAPNMSWGVTSDSIRQDLSHMAGMTGVQMNAAMPAYHARMTRLMDMHDHMMAKART